MVWPSLHFSHLLPLPYTQLSNDELALGSDSNTGLWKETPFCGRPRKPSPLISVIFWSSSDNLFRSKSSSHFRHLPSSAIQCPAPEALMALRAVAPEPVWPRNRIRPREACYKGEGYNQHSCWVTGSCVQPGRLHLAAKSSGILSDTWSNCVTAILLVIIVCSSTSWNNTEIIFRGMSLIQFSTILSPLWWAF